MHGNTCRFIPVSEPEYYAVSSKEKEFEITLLGTDEDARRVTIQRALLRNMLSLKQDCTVWAENASSVQ